MRLDNVMADMMSRLVSRLVRRAIAGVVLGLLALGMIYHLTVAGTLELAGIFGPVYARLIVAGIYAVAALIPLGFLIMTRGKPALAENEIERVGRPRERRVATLLESALLGYSLAKNRPRRRT